MAVEPDIYVGSLFTSDEQCGWPDCDSWKVFRLNMFGHKHGEMEEIAWPLCKTHLFEFLDKYVLKSKTNIIIKNNEDDDDADVGL